MLYFCFCFWRITFAAQFWTHRETLKTLSHLNPLPPANYGCINGKIPTLLLLTNTAASMIFLSNCNCRSQTTESSRVGVTYLVSSVRKSPYHQVCWRRVGTLHVRGVWFTTQLSPKITSTLQSHFSKRHSGFCPPAGSGPRSCGSSQFCIYDLVWFTFILSWCHLQNSILASWFKKQPQIMKKRRESHTFRLKGLPKIRPN